MTADALTRDRRPVHLRRSWLFLPGADRQDLSAAATCGADVLIQEFEDFTVPERRREARQLCEEIFTAWRSAGRLAAARINPLESADGPQDLRAVMAGRPDIVLLPKCDRAAQVARLDGAIEALEKQLDLPRGRIEIVPNIESARGLVAAADIATASPRVTALLLASEDMAADLDAERNPGGSELDYVRQRFRLECAAAGVTAIDCPYTFADIEGLRRETRQARQWGFKAKSLVTPAHASVINEELTPDRRSIEKARRVLTAFDAARIGGAERASVDGHAVELPTANAARRLIARANAFDAWDSRFSAPPSDAPKRG
ncbi:HpcH/HpaI aldolase/citrate lyase family protein [Pseudohoeflea coraliihabitans]|uniref:CoA ester lyase n=1 Tax=Pseudohoeflea coraliihabitans TaxID=2860393 RepID=A0ABS6WIV5_9HYPH|nr:CoA ester lyase [Pseudohoeflea sp. DP4N28-3]MBW3095871.1 CoA ester lyase [Pseudohoeflea sp. DP4N28-3]